MNGRGLRNVIELTPEEAAKLFGDEIDENETILPSTGEVKK